MVKKIIKIASTQIDDLNSKIEFVNDRPGHDLKYAINSSKLKKLGWSSTYNFQDSLLSTIKFYLNSN